MGGSRPRAAAGSARATNRPIAPVRVCVRARNVAGGGGDGGS